MAAAAAATRMKVIGLPGQVTGAAAQLTDSAKTLPTLV
jgi:hypothetical protein